MGKKVDLRINQTRLGLMKVVNIQNAKTQLSKLVEEAAAGDDVVIAKAGKPLVRLVPFQKQGEPRVLGALAGRVMEAQGCWDADPDLEASFYESGDFPKQRVAEDARDSSS
jgi:prevent-host-death family protein